MKKYILSLFIILCSGSMLWAEVNSHDTRLTLDSLSGLADTAAGLIRINCHFASIKNDKFKVTDFLYSVGNAFTWIRVDSSMLLDNIFSDSGNFQISWNIKGQLDSASNKDVYIKFRLGNKDAHEGKGLWKTKAPMSRGRWGMGIGVANDKLYAIGGGNSPAAHWTLVEEYDPKTDSWSTKAPLLAPQEYLEAGVIDGKIYAVGGYSGGYNYLRTVEAYDPQTDRWEYKSPMKYGRSALGVAVANGKLYAIGGFTQVADTVIVLDAVEEYDPISDTWAVKAPFQTKRASFATAAVNGKIYIMGGVYYDKPPFKQTFFNTVEEYDPVADTWTTKSPMPSMRAHMAAGVIDGKIYVVGGAIDTLWTYGSPVYSVRLNLVDIYDPVTDTWTPGPPLGTSRCNLGAGVLNGRLYAIGGQMNGMAYDDTSYLNIVESYSPPKNACFSNYVISPSFHINGNKPVVYTVSSNLIITLVTSSTIFNSDVYLKQPNEIMLFENNENSAGTSVELYNDTAFTENSQGKASADPDSDAVANLVLSILVNGFDGAYEHFSDSKYASFKQLNDSLWEIGFEDLPDAISDWDVDDAIIHIAQVGGGHPLPNPSGIISPLSSSTFPNPSFSLARIYIGPHNEAELERAIIFNSSGAIINDHLKMSEDAEQGYFDWDGRDSNGHKVKSGIYYYEIKYPKKSFTGKIIFIE